MIIFLLTIIATCLVLLTVALGLLWRKIDVYLTWNTRYDTVDYEKTITKPKIIRKSEKASQTEQKGKVIKPISELIDLEDMEINEAMKVVEEAGQ